MSLPPPLSPTAATRVAVAAFAANCVCATAAISATMGVFLVPVAGEFHWPRATVSGVLGVVAVISALANPLVGRAIDAWGARGVLIAGNLGLALTILLLSRATGAVGDFYWRFALVGLFGAMASTAMISKVVANWFDANRGLMLGLTAGGGNGVGATIMPILAGAVLTGFGWRAAYGAVALAVLAIGAPAMIGGMREAPSQTPTAGAQESADEAADSMTLTQALGTVTFWLMLVAVAAGAGGMTAVFTHVVPMLGDRGVPVMAATGVVATFALVCAGWQVVTGGLLDQIRSPRVIMPMFTCGLVGVALLQFGRGPWQLGASGVLLGIGMGSEYAALSYFVSRYFGLKHYGAIIGTLYAVVILVQGGAPVLMDLSFDHTGSYTTATLAIMATMVIGMVLLCFLPHPDEDRRAPRFKGPGHLQQTPPPL